MKKTILCIGGVIIATIALLVSCIKTDENEGGNTNTSSTVQKFIEVQDGTLVKKDKPYSTAEFGLTVNMNSTIIPGGSVIPDVYSPVSPKRMYIGVEDASGYYEVVPQSDGQRYSCVIIINQDLELEDGEGFIIWGALTDADDNISETWEKAVSIHNVGTGQLQVSLSFSNDKDIDLHLVEPNGEHIYYGNRCSDNGGQLDLDSNPSCNIDGINNENITYGEDAFIEPGTYKVYAVMYRNCDATIATDYAVTVTYGGRVISANSGYSNPARGTFEIDAPDTGSSISDPILPVMEFTINNKGQLKTKSFPKTPQSEMDLLKMSMN